MAVTQLRETKRRTSAMFTDFTVKNFRCFAGLHLPHLNRVNLIAGKNNTGKTALLEAIHLHNNPSNSQLPVSINKQRGIGEPDKEFTDVVGWLFYLKHPNHTPDLASFDETGIYRTLTMFLMDAQTTRERFPEFAKSLDVTFGSARSLPSYLPWLTLRYEQTGEQPRYSVATPTHLGGTMHGLSSISARIPWNIPSISLRVQVCRPQNRM